MLLQGRKTILSGNDTKTPISGVYVNADELKVMSWLDWWKKNAPEGLEATECQNHDCHETEKLEGAHVYHDGHPDEIYVVPLCHSHNQYTNRDRMLIDDPKYMVKVPVELLIR